MVYIGTEVVYEPISAREHKIEFHLILINTTVGDHYMALNPEWTCRDCDFHYHDMLDRTYIIKTDVNGQLIQSPTIKNILDNIRYSFTIAHDAYAKGCICDPLNCFVKYNDPCEVCVKNGGDCSFDFYQLE